MLRRAAVLKRICDRRRAQNAKKKEDLAEPAVQGCLYVEKLFVLEKEIRKKNKGHGTIKKERNKS